MIAQYRPPRIPLIASAPITQGVKALLLTVGLVDGGRARITTSAGSAEASVEISEAMLPGHAALPNGFGLDFVDGDGRTRIPGVAPNVLTSSTWRDEYAGTPWHKHVPARIEAVAVSA